DDCLVYARPGKRNTEPGVLRLDYVKNESFKEHAKQIAGKFEVLRIELGAVTTPPGHNFKEGD
ncbi:MAG TPA: DUF6079 family protein, partial [Tissierellaceae bacterium]